MAQNDEKGVSYYLTHPGAAGAAAATMVVSSVGILDPLLTFLTGSVDTWFGLLVTLSRIADLTPALPTGALQTLLLIGGMIYAAILLADLVDKWQS